MHSECTLLKDQDILKILLVRMLSPEEAVGRVIADGRIKRTTRDYPFYEWTPLAPLLSSAERKNPVESGRINRRGFIGRRIVDAGVNSRSVRERKRKSSCTIPRLRGVSRDRILKIQAVIPMHHMQQYVRNVTNEC